MSDGSASPSLEWCRPCRTFLTTAAIVRCKRPLAAAVVVYLHLKVDQQDLEIFTGALGKGEAMRTLEGVLAKHPFFDGLDPRCLGLAVGCAANLRFNADELIFREGEEANRFYLIREGMVLLEVFVPGRGHLIVQTLGGGDILGWSWLVPPYRWMFDARAAEVTRAIVFDGKCLRDKCEADHELGYELLKRVTPILGQGLDATRVRLVDIYSSS
jgi:CRP/FNR family transcriptional regulator, cyclic AMP receptor protein